MLIDNPFEKLLQQQQERLEEALGVYGGSRRRESAKEADADFHSAMTDGVANNAAKKLADDKAAKARAANPDLVQGLAVQPKKRLGEALGVYGGSRRRESAKEADADFHSAMTDNVANNAAKKLADDKAAKARAANPDLVQGLAVQPKKRLGESMFSDWKRDFTSQMDESKHPYIEVMPEKKVQAKNKKDIKESFNPATILTALTESEVITTEAELMEFVSFVLNALDN